MICATPSTRRPCTTNWARPPSTPISTKASRPPSIWGTATTNPGEARSKDAAEGAYAERGQWTARELAIPGGGRSRKLHGDARGRVLRMVHRRRIHRDDRAPLRPAAGQLLGVGGRGAARCPLRRTAAQPGRVRDVHVRGAVLDVVVDIRVGSPTFGQWDSVLLDDHDRRSVYLSEGSVTPSCRCRTARR